MWGLRDKFRTGRRILIQNLDVKSAFRQGGSGSSRGSKRRIREEREVFHRLAALARVEGEARALGSDRHRNPADGAADHKGRIGETYVAIKRRGLEKGGVGVGRGAAVSAAEQTTSEWAGKMRGGGMGEG